MPTDTPDTAAPSDPAPTPQVLWEIRYTQGPATLTLGQTPIARGAWISADVCTAQAAQSPDLARDYGFEVRQQDTTSPPAIPSSPVKSRSARTQTVGDAQ